MKRMLKYFCVKICLVGFEPTTWTLWESCSIH